MDAINVEKTSTPGRRVGCLAAVATLLMWASQPPLAIWPLAMLSVVPWLMIACTPGLITRRDYVFVWLAGFAYWAVSLQGLRHAHPMMYACWLTLAGYLAVYIVLFVVVLRQMLTRRFPIWLAAPVAWVGTECIRNYLLTGISAAMLGHTMADVPWMIQIADLFGSYGVSFVVVSVNVAAFQSILSIRRRQAPPETSSKSDSYETELAALQKVRSPSSLLGPLITAGLLLSSTLAYGYLRLCEPTGEPLATFALVQRSEQVEYMQDRTREFEIFQNYTKQTIASVAAAEKRIDAVVWPESMFTGGMPWIIADADAKSPDDGEISPIEFRTLVQQNRDYYLQRARDVQSAIAASQAKGGPLHIIAGCGVVHYRQTPEVFSGVVHVAPSGPQGPAVDWYGKTHLVMFGEYIPLVSKIPGIREYIKSLGLGLATGPGAKRFSVNGTFVAPNICIETAVERVTVNQLASLYSRGEMPDAVVTVTNDGWFDNSSVIDHHLRCAQFVAAGCRRPVLSAANNGPTAWIDSRGQIVQRLLTGTNGAVIATPLRDDRESLYLSIGDWPARLLGLLCVVFGLDVVLRRRIAGPM